MSDKVRENLVDKMCNITKTSHASLQKGGELRGALGVEVAVQKIYYDQICKTGK